MTEAREEAYHKTPFVKPLQKKSFLHNIADTFLFTLISDLLLNVATHHYPRELKESMILVEKPLFC